MMNKRHDYTNSFSTKQPTKKGNSDILNTRKMKKIDVTFYSWVRCSIAVEVPDDYKPSSTHPFEFWEDLCEKYPDQIETDIMCDEFFELPQYDDFEIDGMGLDYIDSISISDEDGNVVLTHDFEKIQYS